MVFTVMHKLNPLTENLAIFKPLQQSTKAFYPLTLTRLILALRLSSGKMPILLVKLE
jgi:hypothetical protein